MDRLTVQAKPRESLRELKVTETAGDDRAGQDARCVRLRQFACFSERLVRDAVPRQEGAQLTPVE
jgi:hypothetical protein